LSVELACFSACFDTGPLKTIEKSSQDSMIIMTYALDTPLLETITFFC